MQRCSTTSLNANPWLLPSADGTEQRADRWEDLDWDMAAAGAKARQVEEIHAKIFSDHLSIGDELGRGTFGIAYACRFPQLSSEIITVKLPLSYFLKPAVLLVEDERLKKGHTSIDRRNQAIFEFNAEFRSFEQIYDPRALHDQTNFKYGELASDIDLHRHAKMMSELQRMKLHPGRAHIHRVIHYDATIPAIFSEACDGTLQQLRQTNPKELFTATQLLDSTWKMSAEWLRVARHVGSAIRYMQTMGAVHLDIKSNNIFYRRRTDGHNHYMLSDFGFCSGTARTGDYAKCRTTLYFEPITWRMPSMLQYDPTQLSVYTFAALMVSCLKLPNIMFPYSAEKNDLETYGCIDTEVAYFAQRNQTIAAFFPPFFGDMSSVFVESFPEWCHIVNILRRDYEKSRHHNTLPLLTRFLTQINMLKADAEMSDA